MGVNDFFNLFGWMGDLLTLLPTILAAIGFFLFLIFIFKLKRSKLIAILAINLMILFKVECRMELSDGRFSHTIQMLHSVLPQSYWKQNITIDVNHTSGDTLWKDGDYFHCENKSEIIIFEFYNFIDGQTEVPIDLKWVPIKKPKAPHGYCFIKERHTIHNAEQHVFECEVIDGKPKIYHTKEGSGHCDNRGKCKHTYTEFKSVETTHMDVTKLRYHVTADCIEHDCSVSFNTSVDPIRRDADSHMGRVCTTFLNGEEVVKVHCKQYLPSCGFKERYIFTFKGQPKGSAVWNLKNPLTTDQAAILTMLKQLSRPKRELFDDGTLPKGSGHMAHISDWGPSRIFKPLTQLERDLVNSAEACDPRRELTFWTERMVCSYSKYAADLTELVKDLANMNDKKFKLLTDALLETDKEIWKLLKILSDANMTNYCATNNGLHAVTRKTNYTSITGVTVVGHDNVEDHCSGYNLVDLLQGNYTFLTSHVDFGKIDAEKREMMYTVVMNEVSKSWVGIGIAIGIFSIVGLIILRFCRNEVAFNDYIEFMGDDFEWVSNRHKPSEKGCQCGAYIQWRWKKSQPQQ